MKKGKKCGIIIPYIFPFDNVPEDEFQQKELAAQLLSIYRVKLMKSGYKPWMEEHGIVWKKRIGYLLYQFAALFVSQEFLVRQYEKIVHR